MKTINKIIIALAGIAFVACSDFLDTQSPSYDSGGIYESEAGLKEGVVGIYNLLYMEGTEYGESSEYDHWRRFGVYSRQ